MDIIDALRGGTTAEQLMKELENQIAEANKIISAERAVEAENAKKTENRKNARHEFFEAFIAYLHKVEVLDDEMMKFAHEAEPDALKAFEEMEPQLKETLDLLKLTVAKKTRAKSDDEKIWAFIDKLLK